MSRFPKQRKGPTRYKKTSAAEEQYDEERRIAVESSEFDQEEPNDESDEPKFTKKSKPTKIDREEVEVLTPASEIVEPENEISFHKGKNTIVLSLQAQKNRTYKLDIKLNGITIRPMTFTGCKSAMSYWEILKDKLK